MLRGELLGRSAQHSAEVHLGEQQPEDALPFVQVDVVQVLVLSSPPRRGGLVALRVTTRAVLLDALAILSFSAHLFQCLVEEPLRLSALRQDRLTVTTAHVNMDVPLSTRPRREPNPCQDAHVLELACLDIEGGPALGRFDATGGQLGAGRLLHLDDARLARLRGLHQVVLDAVDLA